MCGGQVDGPKADSTTRSDPFEGQNDTSAAIAGNAQRQDVHATWRRVLAFHLPIPGQDATHDVLSHKVRNVRTRWSVQSKFRVPGVSTAVLLFTLSAAIPSGVQAAAASA